MNSFWEELSARDAIRIEQLRHTLSAAVDPVVGASPAFAELQIRPRLGAEESR